MSASLDKAAERLATLSANRVRLLHLLRERQSERARDLPSRSRSAGDTELLPLSWAQERIAFVAQLERQVNRSYRIPFGLRLQGKLDRDALHAALSRIVARHETLRSQIVTVDGEMLQKICAPASFTLEDRILPPAHHGTSLGELFSLEADSEWDLAEGALIRGRLIEVSDEEHVLLITMHHIVADGWSIGVFVRELSQLYTAFHEGRGDPLPPLPIQYADYAQWRRQRLQGEVLERQLSYWRTQLQGAPPCLELPTDRPRPSVQSYRGESVEVVLDAALSNKLKALAQRAQMTLFMVLCAGWALLLSRLSGQEEVLIGTPVANRPRPELEGLIGLFVNTLVLRIEVPRDLPLGEYLGLVKERALGAFDHQETPFEKVVEMLQPPRSLNRNPLFQVMLSLQNAPKGEPCLPGLKATLEEGVLDSAKFDQFLSLEERGEQIAGTLNYATGLFERTTVQRWMACWQVLLEAMAAADLHVRVGQLPLLPDLQRRQLLESFNATHVAYPQERLVHELIEERAQRTPEALAVVCEGDSLTYAELNRRANQLAHELRQRGIGADDVVAVYMQRTPWMLVALLAILKAGAAYLPLDRAYPRNRLAYMLEDAAAAALLTESGLAHSVPNTSAPWISVDGEWPRIAQQSDANPPRVVTARNLAYLIYTSGSTGRPKGVMVEHGGFLNYLQWAVQSYGIGDGPGAAVSSSLSFDATVTSLWGPLLTGRTVFLVREGHELDGLLALSRGPDPRGVVKISPAHLRALGQMWPAGETCGVGSFVIGGEALPGATVRLWQQLAPQARLINEYGPTETVVGCTTYEVRATWDEARAVPIGRPIANAQIYVLDSERQPVPIGVTGEIYIGGAGVARGYRNRAELTAERFVENPFGSGRLYKSGDLGRWHADGQLEYLGRNDQQVKLRGYRIELGEIEAHLTAHPGIAEAAVLVRDDGSGEKRLVAYLVPRKSHDEDSMPEIDALRAHLTPSLPAYMIPSAFVVLAAFPLTAHGKLDRPALPAPELESYCCRDYEPPQNETERALVEVWRELLQVARVGRHDNFFELGGHSLLIVQMIAQLRRRGMTTELRCVFENPHLAQLALHVRPADPRQDELPPPRIPEGCETITPQMLPLIALEPTQIARLLQSVPGGAANVEDIYPLTPLQEGLLFHHLLGAEAGDVYVVSTVLSVSSRRRLEELIEALQGVIDRHDVFRTAILWEHLPRPVNVVLRRAALPLETVQLDATRDSLSQVRTWPEGPQHIDLRRAPLLRVRIAEDTQAQRWFAMLQLHHVICDHVTLEEVISQVVAHLQGRVAAVTKPLPFRTHVAQALDYIRRNDPQSFFRRKLAAITEPTVPFDLLDVYGTGTQFDEAHEELDFTLGQRVRKAARRTGVSAATLFHAAWGLVVAVTSARSDVVFGTVVLGRECVGKNTQPALGMFINTLPLRLQLSEAAAEDFVRHTQQELTQLLSHQQASLAEAQRCSGVSSAVPLFSPILNYRHSIPATGWADASGLEVVCVRERTNYPVTLSVDDTGDRFSLTSHTDPRIDPRRLITYLQQSMRSLVDALEMSPQTPVQALAILPDEERRTVLEGFNATRDRDVQPQEVHELFELQAARTPDAVALAGKDESLTYAELDRRAREVAQCLREKGAVPDTLVAIHAARSLEWVVGVLGILKAGAAYLPLDPCYPDERLAYMVRDAAPKLLLTQKSLRDRLPFDAHRVLELESIARASQGPESFVTSATRASERGLVYVIYTSGSTGQPKGTAMPHHAIANLLAWHRKIFRAGEGRRVLQVAALGFDVACQEVFSTLCTGGTLVVPPEDVRQDAGLLAQTLSRERIHRLFAPPRMLQSLAEWCQHTGSVPQDLEDVIAAGERLHITREIAAFFERAPKCRLHNHYGPTETHVATSLTLQGTPSEWSAIPSIGRPIANARIYVLDARRQPVPLGVAGEIYIGGAGVAHGYLNLPELTAERFLPDPFSSDAEARMYRSGDLGRWHADGTLDFLGRRDDQVKFRGYRIELGEIEAQLARHERVKCAAVVVREVDSGDRRLVAYVTPQDPVELTTEGLREYLKARLPEYMIPSAFVIMESLPLTAHGKLDQQALPAPVRDAYGSERYELPRGEIEEALARIWQEILEVERVGRHDNFFALGGNSLLAMRTAVRIQSALSLEVPISQLFRCATLRVLAEWLVNTRRASLNARISAGGVRAERILEAVASMPRAEIAEWMRKMRAG